MALLISTEQSSDPALADLPAVLLPNKSKSEPSHLAVEKILEFYFGTYVLLICESAGD